LLTTDINLLKDNNLRKRVLFIQGSFSLHFVTIDFLYKKYIPFIFFYPETQKSIYSILFFVIFFDATKYIILKIYCKLCEEVRSYELLF